MHIHAILSYSVLLLRGACIETNVHGLVGVVAEYLAELYEYDGLLAPAVLGQFGTGKAAQQSAARLAEIRAHIEELVFNSELGRTCASIRAKLMQICWK